MSNLQGNDIGLYTVYPLNKYKWHIARLIGQLHGELDTFLFHLLAIIAKVFK